MIAVGLAALVVGSVATGVGCAVVQVRVGLGWAVALFLAGGAATSAASVSLILAGAT